MIIIDIRAIYIYIYIYIYIALIHEHNKPLIVLQHLYIKNKSSRFLKNRASLKHRLI